MQNKIKINISIDTILLVKDSYFLIMLKSYCVTLFRLCLNLDLRFIIRNHPD